MPYRLTGFTNQHGFRVFTFERSGIDHTPTEYTVRTDLALVLKYGVPLQELPLLCGRVLESHGIEDGQHEFTYSEADMIAHEQASAALAHLRVSQKPYLKRHEATAKPTPEPKPRAQRGHIPVWSRFASTTGRRD